jgi:hypothetical protein
MNTCIIGPVVFDRGFYYEKNNDYGVMDGKEKFTIAGPIWKINQLRGLITRGGTEESGGITIRSTKQKDWGPVWINATASRPEEYDNVRLNHKGWYLIRNVDIDNINQFEAKATLTVELINNAMDVFLEMDYTTSPYAGTPLKHGYDLTEELVLLEDDFPGTTLDTSKWSATMWNMTGGSHTVSGGKLGMSGVQTAIIPGMPCWGARSIQSKQSFDAPFYVEFDLEVPDSSTAPYYDGHNHHFVLRPGQWLDQEGWQDTFLIIHDVGSNSRDMRFVKPFTDPLVKVLVSNDNKLHKWKVLVGEDGLITAWLWNSTTSEWDFFWKGPCSLSRMTGLTVGFTYHSHEPVNHTVYTDRIKLYKTQAQVLESVAKIPVTGRNASTGLGSRGSSYLHKNGESDNSFQNSASDPMAIFNGSPRLYSNNNPQNEWNEIHNLEESLKVDKCKFYNDLIQIIPTSTGIEIHRINGASFEKFFNVDIGPISFIKLLNKTPEELILAINRTKWILRRSEPFVYIKHEYNDLTYPKFSCCYHDGTPLEITADDQSISMSDTHYALFWDKGSGTCANPNPAQNLRTMILQKYPTTIKSNKIPATSLTGIGFYDNTLPSSNQNHYSKLALEWLNPVNQRIRII